MLAVIVFLRIPDAQAQAQAQPAQAQAQPAQATAGTGSFSGSGIGINAVMSHVPQEESLSDTGGEQEIDKFEVFIDWNWLRLGYNMTHSALDFTAYNQNWQTTLKTNTTYAAYRMSSADAQSTWDLFLLAGLAYTEASFAISNVTSNNSSDFGFIAGGGAFYRMGRFDIGLQMLVISTEGKFDGIKIATGSTQLLYGMKLNF